MAQGFNTEAQRIAAFFLILRFAKQLEILFLTNTNAVAADSLFVFVRNKISNWLAAKSGKRSENSAISAASALKNSGPVLIGDRHNGKAGHSDQQEISKFFPGLNFS